MNILTRLRAALLFLALCATAASAQNFLSKAASPRLRFARTAPQSGMVRTPARTIAPQATPRRAAATPATLFATVIYSTDLETRPTGTYELTLGTADAALWEMQCDSIIASMGACLSGNTYYVSYQTLVDGFVYDWLDTYDIRTWTRTAHKESGPLF